MTSNHKSGKENAESLLMEINKTINSNLTNLCSATYQSLRKLNVEYLFEAGRDYEAIYNLVQAISSSVRVMGRFKCERSSGNHDAIKYLQSCSDKLNCINESFSSLFEDSASLNHANDDFLSFLHNENKKIDVENKYNMELFCDNNNSAHLNKKYLEHIINDDSKGISNMKQMLNELPKEWTVIQLTASYEECEQWKNIQSARSAVKSFYITVIKDNFLKKQNLNYFNIKIELGKSTYGEKPIFEELLSTLEENLFVIKNNSAKTYWESRSDCDQRMKGIILNMNLRCINIWRCLLSGGLKSENMEAKIWEYISSFNDTIMSLSSTQNFLLAKLLNASHYISMNEVSYFIKKIYIDYAPCNSEGFLDLPCKKCGLSIQVNNLCTKCQLQEIINSIEFKLFKKTVIDIIDKIKSGDEFHELKNADRNPLILLVDEKIDMFPWEKLPILQNCPVTRVECLNMLYALFKNHEKHILNGYYLLSPSNGKYIINPDGELKKMEKRMTSFVEYWCQNWQGEKKLGVSSNIFEQYLKESDIFLYCGHGDGSQYIGVGVERLENIKAVTVLSGCGSVGVRYLGSRFLPIPMHSHLHFANCPMVVGMLWEVTDLEVDKITSTLLSLFLPSDVDKHWEEVDKSQWTHGIIGTDKTEEISTNKWEPDLLRALAIARNSSTYLMISASIVARGIPIKINPNYNLNK